MKIQSFYSRFSLLAVSLLAGVSVAIAQSYYDDDIYYDASKAKKEVKKAVEKAKADEPAFRQQQASQYYYDGAAYVPWNNVGDYNSADSYQVSGTSMRDVDEYNRRTPSVSPAREQTDSITLEQFEEMSNTRNLARFHNSEAAREAYGENLDEGVIGSADSDIYAYSAQPATVNINVIGGGYPYYGYYSSPWYWNSWSYYDPWWGWGWSGPVWSWGWGPSFAWGPSWGWGPSWSWAPSWGWGGPGWGAPVRPNYTSSGAYAPNRTHSSANGYRGSSVRGGAVGSSHATIGNSLGRRPSTTAVPNRTGNSSQATRPGYREPIGVPDVSGTSSGSQRGRAGYNSRQQGSTQNSSMQYNSNTNNRTNNTNSYNYNSNSSRGRTGSFGSSSSSSRGGFSSGGASRGNSAGGGRRGR